MDNIFRIHTLELGQPELISNVYLFEYKGKINIIDTGYGNSADLLVGIEKLFPHVDNVFITHGHFDHIDGLAAIMDVYPQAKCHIHESELKFLEDSSLSLSRHFTKLGYNFLDRHWSNISTFKGGEIIDGIRALHTPGHTAGGASYYIEEYAVCFTGDTLFSDAYGRTDLPTGDYGKIVESIGFLLALDPATSIYPGHLEYGMTIEEIRKSKTSVLSKMFG